MTRIYDGTKFTLVQSETETEESSDEFDLALYLREVPPEKVKEIDAQIAEWSARMRGIRLRKAYNDHWKLTHKKEHAKKRAALRNTLEEKVIVARKLRDGQDAYEIAKNYGYNCSTPLLRLITVWLNDLVGAGGNGWDAQEKFQKLRPSSCEFESKLWASIRGQAEDACLEDMIDVAERIRFSSDATVSEIAAAWIDWRIADESVKPEE